MNDGCTHENPFLGIVLDDYACPSFCSFAKKYFGEEQDIDDFIEYYAALKKDKSNKEHSYVDAWRKFKSGDKEAVVTVAMNSQTFVFTSNILAQKTVKLPSSVVDVKNIYEYSSKLKWNKAIIDIRWVRGDSSDTDGQHSYMRVAKFDFDGLSHESPITKIWSFPDMIWGIPGMLACESDSPEPFTFIRDDGIEIDTERIPQGRMYTRLWIPDKYFESEEECFKDIEQYKNTDDIDIDFSNFYQEIVADG